MHVTFYGAVREVTGSMHMVSTQQDRLLLDCGLYQGRRKEAAEKNRVLPFDPSILTTIVLSHAHMDHSGRIPLLTRRDFAGRVICTRATADACAYLLPDSAHIQQSDADYLNYKTVRAMLSTVKTSARSKKITPAAMAGIKKKLKKNQHKLNVDTIATLIEDHRLQAVEPLYTPADAEHALTFFDGYPYHTPVTVGQDMILTLYEAGHILGSAISIIKVKENGRTFSIGFSGDLGRFGKPILKDPCLDFAPQDRDLDLLIMESTYGDRLHEPVANLKSDLKQILLENHDRGGSILIPAFAFGRTQELLYVLHELYNAQVVPQLPIYVDSPLATRITQVFGDHPEVYDPETHDTFLKQGQNPFSFGKVRFIGSVNESMELMRDNQPHIILSASGMCEAGRILHHLRYKIHNPRNTILIVGYMAANTLGRRILEQGTAYEKAKRSGPVPMLRFLNKEYPLIAHVKHLGGFSAHADKGEMLRFLKQSNLNIKKIALVHGEEDQSLSFARHLKDNGYAVMVPKAGDTFHLK
jgi:metallo-beta-lactamase family protein